MTQALCKNEMILVLKCISILWEIRFLRLDFNYSVSALLGAVILDNFKRLSLLKGFRK